MPNSLPFECQNVCQKLWLDKELCDVKIFCEDKIIESHKLVLCLQSEVLKGMLADNNMAESKSGEIKVTETLDTFEALLYFLYHGNLDENKITADLLTAADFYIISDLIKFCVYHLTKNLTDQNATEVMISAYSTNQKELFNLASKCIQKRKFEGQTLGKEALENLKKKDPNLAMEMLT